VTKEQLLELAGYLRNQAAALQHYADILEGNASGDMLDEPVKSSEEKPITLEQVRAVLAAKSRLGFTAQVQELLKQHGADRLSAINPSEYGALMSDAEVLGNG